MHSRNVFKTFAVRFSALLVLCSTAFVCSSAYIHAGELDPKQKSWYERYKKQDNAPKPEDMLLNTDPEPDLLSGFESIFNGQDLKGWTPKGGKSKFEVRDGLLIGTCIPGTPSTYLSTEKSFKDFVFTCEMKWEEDCNSGVMFRAQSRPGKDGEVVFGPQAEMEGFSKDRHWSGGIYGQSCGGYFYPLWLKEHQAARDAAKEGEWNRVTVLAQGNVVKTWVNGVPAAHWVDDGSYAEGFFGLQIHKGAKGKVLWRDLRVKELLSEHDKVSQHRKPNVLFILADDLGWSDTTLFGTTELYRTPNIARLAERGMTFTRAYSSSPLCSPTRASILTGLSPARHGITSPNCHLPKVVLTATPKQSGPANRFSTIPDSVSRLSTEYYTLAEALHDNGYATGHFGKWHLGAEPFSPFQHGFDVDIPHHPGPGPAGSYVAPWKFKDFDHDPDIPDEHLEDRMAQEAIAFIEQHKDEPFFLNYWMFSVHAPFDAKRDLIERYRKRIRIRPDSEQTSPTYAAMIESMDDAVGTLIDTLDRLGIADNTIIIFASDNGGNMYNYVDGGTATSNAPLRGGKATMYEGGVRGPAIVIAPGKTTAATRSDALIQSSDFYPTLVEMLSIPLPQDQVFDGVSIVRALEGKPLERDAIFTYFPHAPGVPDWLPPAVSVHQGNWKLIRIFFGGEKGQHRYKLFNLADDIGERENLAIQYPDRVTELDALIEQHLVETEAVLPLANPKFDPAKYDVSKEGKAALKGKPGQSKPGNSNPGPRQSSPPVTNWRPSKDCRLSLANHSLNIESLGKDPYIVHSLAVPVEEESLTLHLTLSSTSSGSGQVFWRGANTQRFDATTSKPLDVEHDGEKHDYAVSFKPSGALHSIRIDPSRAVGSMQLWGIRLSDSNGETVYSWVPAR